MDPIEQHQSRVESMIDQYIEGECMQCHKQVGEDYLTVLGPMGDGPAVCPECLGEPQ